MDVSVPLNRSKALEPIEPGRTPVRLRVSLLLAFLALGFHFGASYLLRGHACRSQSLFALHIVALVCLSAAAVGLLLAIAVLRSLPHEKDEEGGKPHDRAHFQALLAIGFNAAFMVAILAIAIPAWVLDPC
jgi:hypothetical protein